MGSKPDLNLYLQHNQTMLLQGHCLLIEGLLLLRLSRFGDVRPCATPETAAHQAPLSLGLSRQEHWSGLPFPSPMHTCMLSRFSRVRLCATLWTATHQAPPFLVISFSSTCMHAKLLQWCPTLCDPMDSSPPGSSIHRILWARTLEWVAISFSTMSC